MLAYSSGHGFHTGTKPMEMTMRHTEALSNPFMMITDPEAILQAVERSERLGRLRRRVCRPLDRPLIPKIKQAEVDEYDAAVDVADESEAELNA
jgi:hypothetical protein